MDETVLRRVLWAVIAVVAVGGIASVLYYFIRIRPAQMSPAPQESSAVYDPVTPQQESRSAVLEQVAASTTGTLPQETRVQVLEQVSAQPDSGAPAPSTSQTDRASILDSLKTQPQ